MIENYTTKTKVLIVLISLTLAYLTASWAIDSGSLVAHVLTFVLVYCAFYFGVRMFKRNNDDNKK